ncbi:DOPA-like domain-containing protein [Hysterangium stoloniferum]|nr:DOPA-like domain-containing protein [Hysterangium stoloniferum]
MASNTLLRDYVNEAPLPTEFNPDGKSLKNVPGPKSPYYDNFPEPFIKHNNGFDFHIYYQPGNQKDIEYAKALHERIRREFPELRIYRFWEKPVGPHPVPMFEVNVFNPHQTGALFSFLAVNRGPCSVLIHPNTGDPHRDHTELATWMGERWPVNTSILRH